MDLALGCSLSSEAHVLRDSDTQGPARAHLCVLVELWGGSDWWKLECERADFEDRTAGRRALLLGHRGQRFRCTGFAPEGLLLRVLWSQGWCQGW